MGDDCGRHFVVHLKIPNMMEELADLMVQVVGLKS